MEADGDHFLAYYLTKDDEDATAFKQNRLTRSPDEPPEDEVRSFSRRVPLVLKKCLLQPTLFHFVRDYETVKVEQEVPNEFLLVLDEGSDPFDTDNKAGHVRPKGAYYKNIERKMLLKKKRGNVCLRSRFPLDSHTDHTLTYRLTSRTETSGMW